jgi:hypothetical protein
LRWFATLPDGGEVERPDGRPFTHGQETVTPRSRTFIPARVADNPYLTATGYVATLQALPEPLRSQLLLGDMSAGIEDDPWQVIPTAWVEAAQARWRPDGGAGVPLTALGVDVARGGKHQTVIAKRRKTWFALLEKHPGPSTPDGPHVAALVVTSLGQETKARVNVDVIGIGSSPYDHLKHKLPEVYAINFGEHCDRKNRTNVLEFVNLRAYAYWSLREGLDPASGDNLALPPDPELLGDLTAPRWEMRAAGVQIEDKESVQERLGRSPDCGDAVVLANLTWPVKRRLNVWV